jgi:hypothetical protein
MPGIRSSCPRTLVAPVFAVSVIFGIRSEALRPATLLSSVAFPPAVRAACWTVGFSATFWPAFLICS